MRRITRFEAKGVGIAALVVVALLIERRYALSARLAPGAIEAWLADAGPLAPLLFVLVMAVAVPSPAPTFPLDVLAGRLFGALPGAVLAVTGATLGASGSFLLARWLGRDFVARFLAGHVDFCRECSDRLLTKVVFFARLVPAVSFDVVSYGAGLTRMSLAGFAAASFLGMIPLTLVYTSVGPLVAVGSVVGWTAGGLTVALFFLLPRWIERYDLFGLARHFRHGGETDAP